jgi:hypothetical protein
MYIVYKKLDDREFTIPYQWHDKIEDTNMYSLFEIEFLRDFFDLQEVKNVSIFGCGEASKIATYLCKRLNINVQCYIDDFIEKDNIINRKTFCANYINKVDAVLFGPHQKGDLEKDFPSEVKKINISLIQFRSICA